MRAWVLLPMVLAGCAYLDVHSTVVRFRDPSAVRVSTRAPDGTVAELPAGAEVHAVAAGGGLIREQGADTRASYTVRLAREHDGTSVLDWSTGVALLTGDEVEVVHGDRRLADVRSAAHTFLTPRSGDEAPFFAHLCVAPERRSSRGGFTGYALATVPNAGADTGCARGMAVDVRTPWSNVFEVRDRVTSGGALLGSLLVINGLPFVIAGAVLAASADTRGLGIPFLVVGGALAGLSIPAFAHTSHDDVIYGAP